MNGGEGAVFAGFLGLLLAMIIGALLLGAFFLWLGLKIVGCPEEKMSFGSVIITAIINAFVPCCIIQWYLIKVRHTDSWGSAIVAWILSWVIPVAIMWGIFLALGLAGGMLI
ncbi:MAG: hypothetical protein Q6363_004380 [Candidatus Njordarchaeota archaeon]